MNVNVCKMCVFSIYKERRRRRQEQQYFESYLSLRLTCVCVAVATAHTIFTTLQILDWKLCSSDERRREKIEVWSTKDWMLARALIYAHCTVSTQIHWTVRHHRNIGNTMYCERHTDWMKINEKKKKQTKERQREWINTPKHTVTHTNQFL